MTPQQQSFLKGILERDKEIAVEHSETARLPEDRKDAARDIEMIDSIIKTLNL
jgi:hypothetical protein